MPDCPVTRPGYSRCPGRLFPFSPCLNLLILTLLALSWASDARADLVFMKDGFVLQGRVAQEGSTEADPFSHQGVWMPRGFFWVNDGARRVAFSPGQMQDLQKKDYASEYDIVSLRTIAGTKYLPPLLGFVNATPWDQRWDRKIHVRCVLNDSVRTFELLQHLTVLTPHYARMDVLRFGNFEYRLSSGFLTRELSPDSVIKLLATHPDYEEKPEMKEEERALRRFRRFHFLVQVGWYDHAEKELDKIRKDLPDQKEKADTALENLKKLRAVELADDVKRAYAAGQYEKVEKQLARLPDVALSDLMQREIRMLRVNLERSTEQLKQARRFLEELPKTIPDVASRDLFQTAARNMLEELNHENVARLAAFLSQAAQAERLAQQKQKPEATSAELMALAVTGWLLGPISAETKVETAERLWRAREFVLRYQQTRDKNDREILLKDYQKPQNNPVTVEEIAQLIPGLPPPVPEEKPGTGVLKLTSDLPGRRQAVTYHLQLPPEYRPGRAYPVIVALHPGDENARPTLSRWAELAGQHGYIVAVPEWGNGLGAAYTYTAAEQNVVFDTISDLRRRFWIDSDRVFLHGFGEGASMAYDVGLSHPDWFAGVIPMGGYPAKFARTYRRNGQYLPFYVVSGDHSGPIHKAVREQFEDWIPKGHPALFVERRGRGVEWFGSELPFIFSWMEHKRRAMPLGEIGTLGKEFQSIRDADNFFYWLAADSISPGCVTDGLAWRSLLLPATFWGSVNREKNLIQLRTTGIKQLSVWLPMALSREGKFAGMVDLNVPLSVWVNGQQKVNGKVKPNMETLLEDLYLRGDRQRLFIARIELNRL